MTVPRVARSFLRRAFGLLLACLVVPCTALGQDRVHQELQELRKEVAGIRQSLARLEEKLGERREPNGELSSVIVTVRDPDGAPVEGARVHLWTGSGERSIQASGVSGTDGVALERNLPYGRYRMSASHGRWSTNSNTNQTIEFGAAFKLEVIVPREDETCSLRIRSALRAESFGGLRFGDYHHRTRGFAGSMGGTFSSPEPGVSARRSMSEWAAFPTVADGVDEVAASLGIGVTRSVDQPKGRQLVWRAPVAWPERAKGALFTSSGEAIPFEKIEEQRVTTPAEGGRFFAPTGPNTREYRGSGYHELLSAGGRQKEIVIELPAGEVKLTVSRFYGRATRDAFASLGLAEDPPGGVWLAANLQPGSEWIGRVMGSSVWRIGASRHAMGHADQTIWLAAGEERVITVGPTEF